MHFVYQLYSLLLLFYFLTVFFLVFFIDGNVRSNVPQDQSHLQYFQLLVYCFVQHPGTEQFGLCKAGHQTTASQR